MAEENRIPVTVFQHSRESQHPLGTVRLLNAGLKNCTVNIVNDDQVVDGSSLGNAWLLFPGQEASAPEDITPDKISNLVVIDGTWKKARKIFHQSPWLRSLPRISLQQRSASRNFLRKTSVDSGLSTVEAVVETLETLEQSEGKYHSMIEALEKMIRVQARYLPPQVREKHYSGKINKDKN